MGKILSLTEDTTPRIRLYLDADNIAFVADSRSLPTGAHIGLHGDPDLTFTVRESVDTVLHLWLEEREAGDATPAAARTAPAPDPIGSFSWALERLKAGARVCRRGWNGKGMWLVLVGPGSYEVDVTLTGGLTPMPYIGMKTVDNRFVPWLASQTDLLADDWEEVGPWRKSLMQLAAEGRLP